LERWGQLEARLREKGRVSVWAVLCEGRPSEVRDGKLVITFRADHQFHYEQINGRFKPEVEAELAAVLGQPVAIVGELLEPPPAGDGQPTLPEADPGVPPSQPAPTAASAEAAPGAPAPVATPPASPPSATDDAESQILRLFPGTERVP
jgi:hypothetical protein